MWKIRENVELKRCRTLRAYFNDSYLAEEAQDQVVNWMDKLGITLWSSDVEPIDIDNSETYGAVVKIKIITTSEMYMIVRDKFRKIKQENEYDEAKKFYGSLWSYVGD